VLFLKALNNHCDKIQNKRKKSKNNKREHKYKIKQKTKEEQNMKNENMLKIKP
jgi:hypothetical protein